MAPPLPSSDADLVRLAHGGRDDAFAALYERYFPRVYDFLARLLGNRQEAADVAQDTFIGALEQLGDLREPERFKSWLFTIAHRRGLNKIRGRRLIAVGSTVDDAGPLARIVDEARFGDPAEAASAAETANTVWEAARGLDERTYVVLDLHVRHGLESAEIADVLGVTKGNAYTMVSRMKRSVADSIGTYLLARKGTADCPDLAAIVAGSALPPMTPSLRRTVERHARECEVCQDTRDKLIAPLEVYGSLVLIPPPDGTQAAIWATIAAAGGAAAAARQDKAGGAAVIGAGAAAGAGSAGSAAAGGGGLGGAGARIAAAAAALVVVGGIAWGGFALAGGSEDPPVEVLSGQLSSGGQGPAGGSDGAGSDPAAGDPTTTLPSDSSTSTTLPPESATSTTVPSASTTTPPPSDSTTTTTVPSTTSTTVPSTTTTTVPSTTTTTVPSTTTTVPQNAPPTAVGPGTISIGEDQTVAFDPMADARDPDGDMVTLARFDATSAQGGSVRLGSLIYTPPADWSGIDTFTYTLTDGTEELTLTVTVIVSPRNDPPDLTVVSAGTVDEGTVGATVGFVDVFDVDGDTFSVSLSGSIASSLAFDADSGTIITIEPLDYETSPGHSIFVRATDSNGASAVRALTFLVADVNEAPSLAESTLTGSIDGEPGDVLGSVSATDPDGDVLQFAIEDSPPGLVQIDGSTGEVRLTGNIPNQPTTVPIVVTATDPGGLVAKATILVDFVDITAPSGDLLISPDTVYESFGDGCSLGNTKVSAEANVSDTSGVTSVVITWTTDSPEGPIENSKEMAFVKGDLWVATLEFGPDTVDKDTGSVGVPLTFSVTDAYGNVASAVLVVTVVDCPG